MQQIVPFLGALSVAAYAMLLWLPVPFDLALYVLIAVAGSAIWLAEPASISTWPWPDGLVVLIVLTLAVSIFASSDVPRSLVLSSAFIPAGLIYLMITRYVPGPEQILVLFLGLVFSVIGISYGILTRAFASAEPLERVKDAAIPILVVPNDVLLLCLVAPLSLSLLVIAKSRLIKAAVIVGLAATLASVVVLESRSALLVLGFSTFVTSLGLARLALALKSLIVGLFSTLLIDGLSGFPLLSKFSSLCDNRMLLWAAAWKLFLEKPVFGHGAHTFRSLYQSRIPDSVLLMCHARDDRIAPWPHNLFLELLSSQGIVGTLVFSATLAWALFVTYSATASDQRFCKVTAWGLLGSLSGFVLAAITELSLLRLWVVVLFAVLIAIAAHLNSCSNVPMK